MKNKPLYEPKDLVPHFNEILCVLLPGPANVNYIFRHIKQTGLPGSGYKRKILEAIKYLEETDFIVDVSGYKWDSGKKQIKRLTVLGRELAELIDSIDQYYKSYSKLTDAIVQKLSHIPYTREAIKQHIEGILGNNGRFDDDVTIDRSAESLYYHTILQIEAFAPESFFSMVFTRYIHVITKSNPDNSDKANETIKKDILNGILTNAITEYLSYILEEKNRSNPLLQRVGIEGSTIEYFFKHSIDNEMQDIIEWVDDDYCLSNNIVEKEVTDTFTSIMSILKPSSRFIDGQIYSFNKTLNQRENTPINDAKVKRNKKLLTLFEEYKMRRN